MASHFILSNSRSQSKLKGPVEIDETKIGSKRRGNHGRIPGKTLWAVGLYCRSSHEIRYFFIPNKATECLHRIIEENCADGSTVITDSNPVYVNLQS